MSTGRSLALLSFYIVTGPVMVVICIVGMSFGTVAIACEEIVEHWQWLQALIRGDRWRAR